MASHAAAVADWLVVGAGPCGVLATARLARSGVVAWVDPAHALGRLPRYASVPGNTLVRRLTATFAKVDKLQYTRLQAARAAAIAAGTVPGPPDGVQGAASLQACDGDRTCGLSLCVDVLADSAKLLRKDGAVTTVFGTLTSLECPRAGAPWTGTVDAGGGAAPSVVRARNVFLVPGAEPRGPSAAAAAAAAAAGVQIVDHDTAVAPAALAEAVAGNPRLKDATWAVVGGSHSALLAAQNLAEAGLRSVVLSRSPLLFAEERPGDWIKFDGTGLKGTVHDFAKRVEAGAVPHCRLVVGAPSDDGAAGSKALVDAMAGCGAAVFCTGFVTDTGAVQVTYEGAAAGAVDLVTGRLGGAPGVWGGGIAYPEVYADPEGHSEGRVGFVNSFVARVDGIMAAAAAAAAAADR